MAEVDMPMSKDAPTNPRGIPQAPFVENVSEWVATRADVEGVLKNFQEMISQVLTPFPTASTLSSPRKYQFMQANNERRLAGLKDKVPDIQKTLDTVGFLKRRAPDAEPLEATFELNDTLYAKANIEETEEVYLWLGANVMLSYPLAEAEELLETKLSAAKSSMTNCEEDLDFLREQVTTMEVATARVYNWDIGERRREKGDGKAGGDDGVQPNG